MSKPTPQYIETFVTKYFGTALWSETDNSEPNGGDPLDQNYEVEDIEVDSAAKQRSECEAFINANWTDLEDIEASQAGHDFWLTRCGHGAGFWDRGHGKKGERLTDACSQFGNVDIVVGDDGQLYFE